MIDIPPTTFALGMASIGGSPPFPVLFFDDGAAVSLHSVRALAVEMGLLLPHGSVFELMQAWDVAFPALVELVRALAYDDRARGHRGHFVTADLLTAERLVPEARQLFRVRGAVIESLPVSVQGAASSTLVLDAETQRSRPNFCLGAVLGRMCRRVDEATARSAIAGWTLATELARNDRVGIARLSAPGSLILGPLLVPAAFAGELQEIPYTFALMGRPVARGTLDTYAQPVAAAISGLSRDCLLLPGDVVIAGSDPAPDATEAGAVDVIESSAPGFGRQMVSLQ